MPSRRFGGGTGPVVSGRTQAEWTVGAELPAWLRAAFRRLARDAGASGWAILGNFAGSGPFRGKEGSRRVLRPFPRSRNVPDTRCARTNRWIRRTYFTRFTLRNPQSQVL